MSARRQTHNGRDLGGHFKVRKLDVDELQTDPNGADYVRDDIRLGGAIEDIGPEAVERAKRITKLVLGNRDDVEKIADSSNL